MAVTSNGLIMIGTPLWMKECVQGAILFGEVAMVSILKIGGIP